MTRPHRPAVTAVLLLSVAASLVLVPTLAGADPTRPAGSSTAATHSATASTTASARASASASPTASTPTPDPAAVAAAQQASRRAAEHVAGLVHGITAAQRQVSTLSAAAQQAQARFDAQLVAQSTATATAALAAAQARAAADAYAREHRTFVTLITAAYESGDNGSGAVSALDGLMSAGAPNDVLVADQDRRLLAERQSQIVAQDRLAALANRSAQLRAESALADVRTATTRLQALRDASRAAATQAGAALDVLKRELTAAEVTQAQADAILSGFLGGWSVADPARAAALNRLYLARVQKWGKHVSAPAQDAVRRAVLYLGTPYAWAGGNASGPTTGVCAGGGAENDCHVVGFDCSGLALYAWAPYVALPHLASSQYTAAGRLHPAVNALQPGDLVFWSTDGTAAGIHHVALYVGDGNVVQAPQSGDIVRITPLGSVDSGYFGATRPLS